MAIMKLSDVPELTKFAGTEKIYVNDNGETKQITYDKVIGDKRIILDVNKEWNVDNIISVMENGDNVWVKCDCGLAKVLSYSWRTFCGTSYYFMVTYVEEQGQLAIALNKKIVGRVSEDEFNRLNNLF